VCVCVCVCVCVFVCVRARGYVCDSSLSLSLSTPSLPPSLPLSGHLEIEQGVLGKGEGIALRVQAEAPRGHQRVWIVPVVVYIINITLLLLLRSSRAVLVCARCVYTNAQGALGLDLDRLAALAQDDHGLVRQDGFVRAAAQRGFRVQCSVFRGRG